MTTPPLDPRHGKLVSGYGLRWRDTDLHTGIDLAAPRGEPVYAVRDGLVLLSAPSGQLNKYGNVIVIQHSSGEATLYAHLEQRQVQRGDRVSEGQQIGTVGDTAGTKADPSHRFAGTHLHFELLTHWPPPGIDRGRIDPTRLWPPAIEGRDRPRGPQLPTPAQLQRPAPRNSGDGAAGVMVALALYALSRR